LRNYRHLLRYEMTVKASVSDFFPSNVLEKTEYFVAVFLLVILLENLRSVLTKLCQTIGRICAEEPLD